MVVKQGILILFYLICLLLIIKVCVSSDWIMLMHDLNHTGVSLDSGPKTSNVLWKFNASGVVYSSPIIVNNIVYVGSDLGSGVSGKFYALNLNTGEKIWEFSAKDKVDSSGAYYNDVVFVGSRDRYFYALNASNGEQIWNFSDGCKVYSSPAVYDDKVYFGTYGYVADCNLTGTVYALNVSSGKQVWNYTTGDRIFSSPAVINNIVYIGSYDKNFYALNASNGSKIWNFTMLDWIYSGSSYYNGVVYVGCRDNRTYALNASTGKEIWNFTTGWKVLIFPAVSEGIVYIDSWDNRTYALNASTGKEIWNFSTDDKVESSPAVSSNGIVYVGSMDKKLYALNKSTGELIWSYEVGDRPDQGTFTGILSSPAISNGIVVVGAYDHYVYAFKDVVSSSGGGVSKGGKRSYNIYDLGNIDSFGNNEGLNKEDTEKFYFVKRKDIIRFSLGGDKHKILVKEVKENYILILISSEEKRGFKIFNKKFQEIDVDLDNKCDLIIKVEDIINNLALISIQINDIEEVSSGTIELNESLLKKENLSEMDMNESKFLVEDNKSKIKFMLIVYLCLLILVFLLLKKFRKV